MDLVPSLSLSLLTYTPYPIFFVRFVLAHAHPLDRYAFYLD